MCPVTGFVYECSTAYRYWFKKPLQLPSAYNTFSGETGIRFIETVLVCMYLHEIKGA